MGRNPIVSARCLILSQVLARRAVALIFQLPPSMSPRSELEIDWTMESEDPPKIDIRADCPHVSEGSGWLGNDISTDSLSFSTFIPRFSQAPGSYPCTVTAIDHNSNNVAGTGTMDLVIPDPNSSSSQQSESSSSNPPQSKLTTATNVGFSPSLSTSPITTLQPTDSIKSNPSSSATSLSVIGSTVSNSSLTSQSTPASSESSSSSTSSLVLLPSMTTPNSGSVSPTALLPTITTFVANKNVVPDIIGGVVGGLFLLIIVVIASLFLCRRRRRLRLQVTNPKVEPLPFSPQSALATDKNGRFEENRPSNRSSVLAVSATHVAEVLDKKAVIQDQYVNGLQTDQASPDRDLQASMTPGKLEARMRQQMQAMGERIMELESQQKELSQIVGGNILDQQRPPEYSPASDPRTVV